jgi:hypothetical protein
MTPSRPWFNGFRATASIGAHEVMHLLAAAALLAPMMGSAADIPAPPDIDTQVNDAPAKPVILRDCRNCGVVRSIREIRNQRQFSRPDIYVTSPQYLDTRPQDPPQIGPVISFSWGAGETPQTKIGAIGSPSMQQRFVELSYEVGVRFEDGRFGLIEQDDIGDISMGDRVQVIDRRVERF